MLGRSKKKSSMKTYHRFAMDTTQLLGRAYQDSYDVIEKGFTTTSNEVV